MNAMTPTRRGFLGSGALVIGLALPMGGARARGATTAAADAPIQANAFVKIAPDNSVTVIIKHVEFGQGPATGLTTLVADEMDADWGQMRIEFAPANDPLYKNLFFGTMGTGGSTAMANSFMQMRSAGAAARAMLVDAAAKRWGVKASDITVAKGVVSSGSNKASFGELAADAATMTPPAKPVLKTPDQWTLIGTDVPKLDSAIKTNGTAPFGMDVMLPDMVHTAILHPPAFGGVPKSVDDAAALAVPGVKAVRTIPQGVVVYADSFYAAQKGRQALKAEWDLAKAETRSSEQMFKTYAEATTKPGYEAEKEGDVAAAMAGAAKTLEAVYAFPFLAHAPMEPLDTTILAKDGTLDVWMGSQFQVAELGAMAGVMGVPFEKATLHQLYAGGSFGRRTQPDAGFVIEAASAAKAYGQPVPVKHVWTRENDIKGGRYRPIVVHRLKGGIDASGKIVAWDQVVAAQSFMVGSAFDQTAKPGGIDVGIAEGAADDYGFPNARFGVQQMQNGVPTLWWRSVGNTHTGFAKEAFIDELAELAGSDPVATRMGLLKEDRAKAVLKRVAELADWGNPVAEGRARGVAFHKSFGSYVAQIAEVSKGTDGLPKVHKIWCAVDCGVPVTPNIIRAQMEGGIGYGLGHALYAEIVLGEGGIVQQGNFDTYRSLRIHEMPEIEVAIIKSSEMPTGVGEPGLPPTAPAVANAWRKLTGKAVRRLPFTATGEIA